MGMSTMYRGASTATRQLHLVQGGVRQSRAHLRAKLERKRKESVRAPRSVAHLFLESDVGQRVPTRWCADGGVNGNSIYDYGHLYGGDLAAGRICLARIDAGGDSVPTPVRFPRRDYRQSLDRQQAAARNARQRIGLTFFERSRKRMTHASIALALAVVVSGSGS